jgi:hydroxymethylpyrimidine/phosphomethylpyrimidine kinase
VLRTLAVPNLVVDPVMVAKSGDSLLTDDARAALLTLLLPLALVVTPNLPEAAVLVGHEVRAEAEMRDAARALRDRGVRYVVVKGGHLGDDEDAADVVYDGATFAVLRSARIPSKNTHGTGCTFSAAIAAGLAQGRPPMDAISIAKRYITAAIAEGLPLGAGHGPTNHLTGVRSIWSDAAPVSGAHSSAR